jgi:hypothetical protein
LTPELNLQQRTDLTHTSRRVYQALVSEAAAFCERHDMDGVDFANAVVSISEALAFAAIANNADPAQFAEAVEDVTAGLIRNLTDFSKDPASFGMRPFEWGEETE